MGVIWGFRVEEWRDLIDVLKGLFSVVVILDKRVLLVFFGCVNKLL